MSQNNGSVDMASLVASVARIDERTEATNRTIHELKGDFNSFKDEIRQEYVTEKEFSPIKKICFGLVGIIVITVIGAILRLIIKGG